VVIDLCARLRRHVRCIVKRPGLEELHSRNLECAVGPPAL
jgi:hypothetical protein